MSVRKTLAIVVALACHVIVLAPQKSFGQAFGVELQASVLPASGGMGGAGIARPQELQTSLALNPATLSQMKGTQFSFGGALVEPTINLDNAATIIPAASGMASSKVVCPINNSGLTSSDFRSSAVGA